VVRSSTKLEENFLLEVQSATNLMPRGMSASGLHWEQPFLNSDAQPPGLEQAPSGARRPPMRAVVDVVADAGAAGAPLDADAAIVPLGEGEKDPRL
jgi:hypothetical protein